MIRLGDLETAVMELVWDAGACDVKAAHRAIGRRRQITLNTVQSTMERLYRKGFLRREKISHAYVYAAAKTRQEVTADGVSQVVATLGRGETDAVLAAFVDVAARAGDKTLARLEALIAEHRAAKKGR